MKKDNKALNDLDQEFNLFMHSQVPEVEPENADTIHSDYELPPSIGSHTHEYAGKGIPMISNIPFKEPGQEAYDAPQIQYVNPAPLADAIEGPGYAGRRQQNLDFEQAMKLAAYYGGNIQEETEEGKKNMPKLYDVGLLQELLDYKPQPKAIQGQDILDIRALTGKKRDNAIEALYASTVEMLNNASPDCFFVRGNTASSKNSKEIGFYLKKNQLTGKNDKVNILMDSKVTKKYKKETAGYWLQNKVAFVNQVRNLPLPLSIEFTFIRDTMRRFDLINAAQVVADLMTEYGWIPDDESVYFHPVFNKTTYYHNQMAGVLIRVIK